MEKIKAIRHSPRVWAIFGAWPSEKFSPCKLITYQTYFFIIFTFVSFANILAKVLKACFFIDDLGDMAESLFILLTEIVYLPKLASIVFYRQRIRDLIKVTKCEIFQPKDEGAARVLDKEINMMNKLTTFYQVAALVSAVSYCLVPILEGTTQDYTFAFKIWYPWKTDYYPVYPILYFHQSFAVTMHCILIITIDSFGFSLMALASGQFDMLGYSLSNVATEIDHSDSPEENNSDSDKMFKGRIVTCIEHHLAITKFLDDVVIVFGSQIFIQIILSSIILCVTSFQLTLLSPAEEPIAVIMTLCYGLTMLFQIFLPCWFGNEVILKSSNLGAALYRSNWAEKLTPQRRPIFRIIKVFMERVKRPSRVFVGGMLELSMSTFTSILNSAYSYYAVLQHMNSNS